MPVPFASFTLISALFCFEVSVALLTYSSCNSRQDHRCSLQSYATRIFPRRHFQPMNTSIQIELLSIFDGRPLHLEKINSFLDQYQQDMDSINIMTLLNKLKYEKIHLHDHRLIKVIKMLRDMPEELRPDDIGNLVRFSNGVSNLNLKYEIWNAILSKVLSLLGTSIFCLISSFPPIRLYKVKRH